MLLNLERGKAMNKFKYLFEHTKSEMDKDDHEAALIMSFYAGAVAATLTTKDYLDNTGNEYNTDDIIEGIGNMARKHLDEYMAEKMKGEKNEKH